MSCDCWMHQRLGPRPEDLAPDPAEVERFVTGVREILAQQKEKGMSVLRCKMRVSEVLHSKDADGSTNQERIKLSAVYGAEGTDNAQWSKWTPNASFEIYINNPDAMNKLSTGHEFYVDFTPAEAGETAKA